MCKWRCQICFSGELLKASFVSCFLLIYIFFPIFQNAAAVLAKKCPGIFRQCHAQRYRYYVQKKLIMSGLWTLSYILTLFQHVQQFKWKFYMANYEIWQLHWLWTYIVLPTNVVLIKKVGYYVILLSVRAEQLVGWRRNGLLYRWDEPYWFWGQKF